MAVQLRPRAVVIAHVPPLLHVGGSGMAMRLGRRWWQMRLLGAVPGRVGPHDLRQFDIVGFPLH